MRICAQFLAVAMVAVGCAQSKENSTTVGAKRVAAASSGGNGSADGTLGAPPAERKEVETPLFVGAVDDIDLSCKQTEKLRFMQSQGLNPTNSYLLARFSMVGASSLPFDKSSLAKWLERFGLEKVVFVENVAKGVRGFVALSSKFNLVVFQGTHSLQGAMTDLQAIITSASSDAIPGGMHKGFRDAYESVSSQLSEALNEGKETQTPTYFVGHSLGGALAVIASAEQQKAGVSVAGVVTLGQPRVGNQEFAAAFEKTMQNKYNRYVYGNDPVPHLPPTKSTGGQLTSSLAGASGLLGVVNAGAGLLASGADFKHATKPQTLGSPRFAATGFENDDSWDQSYWENNASAFGQILLNPLSLQKDSLIADHDVNKYLCVMLQNASGN